ncbi:MAG: glycosyltransferase family 2 protein [Saprospiraceae bacterium]|nr:glycosyltransferase family 2 protein [Saprospiraceae bacterium]
MADTGYDILFSIIMPTYNRANMIATAIESVLKQTYKNWELIIVNDGSTDDTAEVLKYYTSNDCTIKHLYQENKGRSSARNAGIELAEGKYACFLDDDDYYLENFLMEFYLEICKEKDLETLFMCQQFEETNSHLKLIKNDRKKIQTNPFKYLIQKSNNLQPFAIPLKILKKEKFDERFELGEDFHLLIRLLINKNLRFINKATCVYKNHSEMTMERELKDGLFFKLPYNRLDIMDDIDINHHDLLIQKKVIKDFYIKYNRIAYFYASASLKNYRLRISLFYILKLKFHLSFIPFFYFLSILLRIPFNYFKQKLF